MIKQRDSIADQIKTRDGTPRPIIPISAALNMNIEAVVDYICRIPVPIRDFTSSPRMTVVRSFDINKPGTEIENLVGGVAGGTLIKGVLRVGDEIAIRPG